MNSEHADNGDEDSGETRDVLSNPTGHEQDEMCRRSVKDTFVNTAMEHRVDETCERV